MVGRDLHSVLQETHWIELTSVNAEKPDQDYKETAKKD